MTTEQPLAGRIALVAGASRGIGADIARALAAAGAKVAVAARTEVQQDPRLPGTIHSVTESITAAGGTALPVVMNLRDPESIDGAVARTVAEWGGLDILVNNAAIFVPGDMETVQPRHIELSLQVNLRGPILMMKAAIPHMLTAGRGHIINISSRGAIAPGPGPYSDPTPPGDIFYGPEKSAIEHFTQRQAWTYQLRGLSANVLSPAGRIRTPGNIFFENDRDNPTLEFEDAEAMGKATVWVCSQPADQLNGAVLYDEDIVTEHGL